MARRPGVEEMKRWLRLIQESAEVEATIHKVVTKGIRLVEGGMTRRRRMSARRRGR